MCGLHLVVTTTVEDRKKSDITLSVAKLFVHFAWFWESFFKVMIISYAQIYLFISLFGVSCHSQEYLTCMTSASMSEKRNWALRRVNNQP